MKRGRPNKPAVLSLLDGNPGKRPIKQEPKISNKTPKMPPHLNEEAKKEWKRVIKILGPSKILSEADGTILGMYCESYARWCEAAEEVKKIGLIVKSPNGWPMRSPYLDIVDREKKNMMQYLSSLGMTPTSRAGLGNIVEQPEDTYKKNLDKRQKLKDQIKESCGKIFKFS